MHFQFAAQRLGEPHDREFRRAVDTEPRHPYESCHRRRIEYVAALLLLDQARCECLYTVHDAPEVDVHREPPVVGRHLEQRPGDRDAGVVADEVCRSEVLEDALGESVDAGALGHVGADAKDLGPAFAQQPGASIHRRFVEVGEGDLRAARASASAIAKPMPPAPPVITHAAAEGSIWVAPPEGPRIPGDQNGGMRSVESAEVAAPASGFEAARSSTAR
jgi:hypothetical protein